MEKGFPPLLMSLLHNYFNFCKFLNNDLSVSISNYIIFRGAGSRCVSKTPTNIYDEELWNNTLEQTKCRYLFSYGTSS